jgi:D-beta-D-heptose 7-phosphate kinase/D-beta-D-heptose 1-phosphate adenosyltransferase
MIRHSPPPRACGRIVQSAEELSRLLAAHCARGQRIVFTNGCFDLFHLGHLRTLEAARRLADVLVVAVNSDSSVRRIKGPPRPFVPQQERAAIVAALVCVDYVIIFEEKTPRDLIRQLRPDVITKGGTSGPMFSQAFVEAYGGRAVKTPTIQGVSTTRRVAEIVACMKTGSLSQTRAGPHRSWSREFGR